MLYHGKEAARKTGELGMEEHKNTSHGYWIISGNRSTDEGRGLHGPYGTVDSHQMLLSDSLWKRGLPKLAVAII